MGESYIKLGEAEFWASIPAGTDSEGAAGWFWWYPSRDTQLAPSAGENALWGWSSNTQFISGLRSGLALQADQLGKDYANKMQRLASTLIPLAPMPFLASLKNSVSGDRWSIGVLEDQYRSFSAQHGNTYGTWVRLAISGLARTDQSKLEAWIDPRTVFVNSLGPVVTGFDFKFNFFNPNSDSVKVFLNNGTAISGVLNSYP